VGVRVLAEESEVGKPAFDDEGGAPDCGSLLRVDPLLIAKGRKRVGESSTMQLYEL
jgi:hypothetical protein